MPDREVPRKAGEEHSVGAPTVPPRSDGCGKVSLAEGVKRTGLLKLLGSSGLGADGLDDVLGPGDLDMAFPPSSALAGAGSGESDPGPIAEWAVAAVTGRSIDTGGEAVARGQAPLPSAPTASREAEPDREENWVVTASDRESTFAADVDTASYSHARRALESGQLPLPQTVRPEEFVNYFRYRYPGPSEDAFAVHSDLAPSPFSPGRHLMRIGIQGRRISVHDLKRMHLTFLVDVSGSMEGPDRLPLVKESLGILLENLRDDDTVALVTYAGETREVFPMTPVRERRRIRAAIDALTAGGGTAMGSGVELAYRNAVRALRPNEVSRVLVLSDGDANIGSASHEEMLRTIEGHVKEGVTLSTIGFGMGNYRDRLMEQLADRGNGNNFYVDSVRQARRIFEEQLAGNVEILAKDVKLQVEFEPGAVRRYRLVGYENREVADRDFRNDRADGGEVGAGQSVTALYELELSPDRGSLLATVRIRAKAPNRERSFESEFPVTERSLHARFQSAPASLRLAAVAAAFGDTLRRAHGVPLEALRAAAAELPGTDPDVAGLKALIGSAAALDTSPGCRGEGPPSLEVEPSCDRSAIEQFLRGRARALAGCYRRGRNPLLVSDHALEARFVITATGRVSDVEIAPGPASHDDRSNCLRATIRGWVFPVAGPECRVTYRRPACPWASRNGRRDSVK
jgi:Ca-activated chloride channel family protein